LAADDHYRWFRDVCFCGPKNREELNEALKAGDLPPMTDEEMTRMRRIGSGVRTRKHHNWLVRKVIFD